MRAHPHTTSLIWPHTTIRRRLSSALRILAILAAASCALAAAPAASARSVAGEYTPAAVLTTDAPVVLVAPAEGTDPAPLITAPAAPIIDAAPEPAPAAVEPTPAPVVEPAPAPAPAPMSAPAATPVPASRQSAIATAIAAAHAKLGTPYVYGGAGPYAFDCSGFTRWVYLQAGIELAHFSGAQWAATVHIPMDQLQPGDLVFNWGFGGGAPDHVGLYLGDGMMIHAPNGGGSVRIDSIWWWTGASVAAGRLP